MELDAIGRDAGARQRIFGCEKRCREVVIALLVDAFRASKADQQGFVGLGELGNHAAKQSGFKASNHGYARLSDLLNDTSMFKAERRNGKFYVRLAQ